MHFQSFKTTCFKQFQIAQKHNKRQATIRPIDRFKLQVPARLLYFRTSLLHPYRRRNCRRIGWALRRQQEEAAAAFQPFWILVVGRGEADLNRIKQKIKSRIIIHKNAWSFQIVPKCTLFRGGRK
jgi:hypothetical protein